MDSHQHQYLKTVVQVEQNLLNHWTVYDNSLRKYFIKLNKPATYGTAGFRDLATNMPYIVFRVGVFVALLNKIHPSKCLGVVISASHNKKEDNGVKITNFKGNMLEMEYEKVLYEFVNEESLENAISNLKAYLIGKNITFFNYTPVNVFIGGDTRLSTNNLLNLLTKGVYSQTSNVVNFGLTTTPQLQFYVYLHNEILKPKHTLHDYHDPEELRKYYWNFFSTQFIYCARYLEMGKYVRTIDCANGVGGKIMPYFSALLEQFLYVKLINYCDDEFLNEKCGADFVKTNKLLPKNFYTNSHNSYVSFDGDADRIVFYTYQTGKLNLIDGDRIGTVLTYFFKTLITELSYRTSIINKGSGISFSIPTDPTIGFVQTYYANYSSSEYLKTVYGMYQILAATGVKYLHYKAEHYDIGIYFEANGHGTVIFKDNYLQRLDALLMNRYFIVESVIVNDEILKQKVIEYFKFIYFFISACKLSNPSVGDAISVFLLFEIALKYLKKDYNDVLNMYTDLESLTSKIQVVNKQALKVTDIEDRVVSPEDIQPKINAILEKQYGKKAFLRASGTENVLRLHVEAASKDQCYRITHEIKAIVESHPSLN